MIKFNRNELRDKINACWLGKNIGGTIGTPFEGRREILDIPGFTSPPGEPLVNDDLDLQLVWLKAMEDFGPAGVNERVLGEYWLSYITPHWNEYGIGKSNMRMGFPPPLSGEVNNEDWRHSNGAWIRTEIWACLFPGQVDKAIRYAYYDSCVDHGHGEGMFGAIFVEAMESAAFVVKDLLKLIDIGLSKIPESSRVAQSVRLVVEEFKKGTDWKTVRNMVVADSEDLGWFQAPANIAFTMIGLLWGEGDFKKTVITAVNCGDDTDCTGATAGALMGILYGMDIIPADWKEYLGDKIVSGCLSWGHVFYPKTCTQLTDNVMDLLNVTLHDSSFVKNPVHAELTDGESNWESLDINSYFGRDYADELGARKRYSFAAENVLCEALIEFDNAPYIKTGETLTGSIKVKNREPLIDSHYCLRFFTEEGITVSGNLTLQAMPAYSPKAKPAAVGKFSITADESIKAVNRIVVEIAPEGRFTSLYVQLVVLG